MTNPNVFSRSRIIATISVAAVIAVGAPFSYAYGQDNAVTFVVAEFTDASPLLEGNTVKINGVKVGEVATMRAIDGVARVALEFGPGSPPLHQDASAAIKADSILGERFVAVDPGSPAAPLLETNGVIAADRTSSDVDLQELVNAFDNPTSSALAAMVGTLGAGFEGNGENVAAAISALAPAMDQTDQLVSVLRDQNEVLNSLVDTVAPVTASVAADDGARLDGLVQSLRDLFSTTSADKEALERTLAELAPTLTSARVTLAELRKTADSTTPTLRSLRPTTSQLEEFSEELDDFAEAADPALDELEPLLYQAKDLLLKAQPVAEKLRELGGDLKHSSASLRPVVGELDGNIVNVMEFIKRWALTTNGRDGLGHYFRANVGVGVDSVSGQTPLGGDGGIGGTESQPPSNPRGAPEPPSDDGEIPQVVPPEIYEAPGMLAPGPTPDGSATGMTEEQEQGALDFMLGGG